MCVVVILFFFNDTATTEIYTLSLHDALPISSRRVMEIDPRNHRDVTEGEHHESLRRWRERRRRKPARRSARDRKSTRLNSSHANISYAVFCLKKKNYILNAEWRLRTRGNCLS